MAANGYGRCPVCKLWAYTVAAPFGTVIAIHWTADTTVRNRDTRCRGTYEAPLEVKPLG